jgi:hypothetical protein
MILAWNSHYFRQQYQVVSLWMKTPSVHYSTWDVNFIILGCARSQSKWYISNENSCRTECLSCMSHQNYLPNFGQNAAFPTRSKYLHNAAFQNTKRRTNVQLLSSTAHPSSHRSISSPTSFPNALHCFQRTFTTRTSESTLAGDIHSSQWRTQEFRSCGRGGVQQIQLRTEGRENGDPGAAAPLVKGSAQFANEWNLYFYWVVTDVFSMELVIRLSLVKTSAFRVGAEPPKPPSVRHWLQ